MKKDRTTEKAFPTPFSDEIGEDVEQLRAEISRLRFALKEREDLINISPAFFGYVSPTGVVLSTNELSLKIIESPVAETIGHLFWECRWWKSLPNSAVRIHDAVMKGAGGSPSRFNIQYCAYTKGVESRRWVAITITPFRDLSGRVNRMAVSGIDITERKDTQAALHKSQEDLSAAVEISKIGFYDWDILSDQITFSDQMKRDWGVDPATKMLLPQAINLLHPDDREPVARLIKEAIDKRSLYRAEYRVIRPNGTVIWIEAHGKVDYSPSGEAVRFFGTSLNITERKEMEERFRSLANALPQLAWMTDDEGWVFWFNRRWYAYTGSTFEQMQGWDWIKAVHPDHAERVTSFVKECWKKLEPCELTFPLRSQTGEYRWFLTRAVPVLNSAGGLSHWFGTNTDINDQLQAQEELIRANSELARFAFVASHDLKEPLRTVSNYSQLIQRQYKGKLDRSADEYINFITQGVSRMYELINDLLSYSRVGATETKRELVDVNRIYLVALENLDSSIREKGAEIKADRLPEIYADSSQLLQLFQNIIGNSIKYHGREPLKVQVSVTETKEEWVFSVSDNGIGIDPNYFEKIFILFQRLHSKDEYSGTGIGLAVCKRIVENHKGRIWVESEVGKGSTFYFTFPKERA